MVDIYECIFATLIVMTMNHQQKKGKKKMQRQKDDIEACLQHYRNNVGSDYDNVEDVVDKAWSL